MPYFNDNIWVNGASLKAQTMISLEF